MKNFGIAVHGGAGDETPFLESHLLESEEGLKAAVVKGYAILEKGGSALDAVEEAVKILEDNPVYNAGRGSVLNSAGEIEMDAAFMDGKTLKAGAVAVVRNVKNPIVLARTIMDNTHHVLLSGEGALEYAKKNGLVIEPDSYFMTERQYENFLKESKQKISSHKKVHGTVGAVALDKKGNLAAGTSTGGIEHSLPGRIGDSCIIGAGCYANNKTCAVSATGEGEVIILNVIGHTISDVMEFKKYTLQKACNFAIKLSEKKHNGDIGVISIDAKGNVGIAYDSQVMKRAWMTYKEALKVKIY